MLSRMVDLALYLPARVLTRDYMKHAGIDNTMAISRAYTRVRYNRRWHQHRAAYRNEFDALLAENGGLDPASPPVEIRDGWALDTRGTLPHLQRLLDETAPLIAERGGKKHASTQQPYFRSLLFPGDVEANPSFLDFALSSPLLATVARYMGTIPVLSKTRPPGVRFMESSRDIDPIPDRPFEESQLYHRDLYDEPLVYVLVALQDITEACGPWTFLPAGVSAEATKALGYRRLGVPYRLSDSEVYAAVDRRQAIPFTAKRGTVLFIDSGACFHFGSRNAVVPRYMMMYGFTTPSRTDLSQIFMRDGNYPVGPEDSRLRRMVLG